MVTLYLGPGVGIGSIIATIGIGIAILFVLYAFVVLPIRKALRKKQEAEQAGSSQGNTAQIDSDLAALEDERD